MRQPCVFDLTAIRWSINYKIFQHYLAEFTILSATEPSDTWLDDITKEHPPSMNCPMAWRDTVEKYVYRLLHVSPMINYHKDPSRLIRLTELLFVKAACLLAEKESDNPFQLATLQEKRVVPSVRLKEVALDLHACCSKSRFYSAAFTHRVHPIG